MYFKHLFKNWKVAFHALWDFISHFVHGLFPFIKIKHHQPTNYANKNMNTQPIKHGKWVCVGHDDTTYWYKCSSCGHEEHDNSTKHDNYCCCCGAYMKSTKLIKN